MDTYSSLRSAISFVILLTTSFRLLSFLGSSPWGPVAGAAVGLGLSVHMRESLPCGLELGPATDS